MSERFFDDHSPPSPVLLARQTGGRQLLNDLPKKSGRGRQIKHVIAAGLALPVQSVEPGRERGVHLGIRKLPALVVEPLCEPLPCLSPAIFSGQKSCDLSLKLFQSQVVHGNAQHREFMRKQARFREIKKRRNQLAFRQVAGCPEEHHHTGASSFAGLVRFASWIPSLHGSHGIFFQSIPRTLSQSRERIVGHRTSDFIT